MNSSIRTLSDDLYAEGPIGIDQLAIRPPMRHASIGTGASRGHDGHCRGAGGLTRAKDGRLRLHAAEGQGRSTASPQVLLEAGVAGRGRPERATFAVRLAGGQTDANIGL